MKKAIFSATLILFLLPAYSQVAKGMKTFGIDLAIQSSSSEYSGSDSKSDLKITTINPRFGFLLHNELELGLGLSYLYFKNKNVSPSANFVSENSENIFSILPYVKWYHPISEHFYFNLTFETGIGIGSRSQEFSGSTGSTYDYDVSLFSVSLTPEFAYAFNNHWALNFGLGSAAFTSTIYKDTDSDEKNTDTSFGLFGSFAGGLSLGATYYF